MKPKLSPYILGKRIRNNATPEQDRAMRDDFVRVDQEGRWLPDTGIVSDDEVAQAWYVGPDLHLHVWIDNDAGYEAVVSREVLAR